MLYNELMEKKVATLISGPLQTERMSNGKRKLLRELKLKAGEDIFLIEKDFETDFSSIPWFGRFVVRWSKVDIAGVVHDWLYVKGTTERKTADRIWRITARSGEHHANEFQAWICWLSLRIAGWYAWNRYRKIEAVEES